MPDFNIPREPMPLTLEQRFMMRQEANAAARVGGTFQASDVLRLLDALDSADIERDSVRVESVDIALNEMALKGCVAKLALAMQSAIGKLRNNGPTHPYTTIERVADDLLSALSPSPAKPADSPAQEADHA